MKSFRPFRLLSGLGLLSAAALASVQVQAYNCNGVANYQQGTYSTGAIVKNGGNAYSCTDGVLLAALTSRVWVGLGQMPGAALALVMALLQAVPRPALHLSPLLCAVRSLHL